MYYYGCSASIPSLILLLVADERLQMLAISPCPL